MRKETTNGSWRKAWRRSPTLAIVAFGLLAIAGLMGVVETASAQQQPPQPTQVQPGSVPGGVKPNFSDAEMWRAVRQGVQGSVSIPDKKAGQLVQSEGDNWRAFHEGPLVRWGAIGMALMIVLLTVFYLVRGRIRVERGLSGRTIVRFGFLERMSHWLLAVSFIILGLTGLNITYGKRFLMPVIGKDAFATITLWGKYLHNYLAFAFMVGLVMIAVLWILENIPNRHDVKWLAKGGGILWRGEHPPAKKFNAGQKIIFWLVVLGGFSLSLSGIALMWPFELALFSKTFAFLNIFGLNLPTNMPAVQEMQYAALWHAIVAIAMVAIILAHIYIGTIGMEGAFDAMGSGEVDVNWAREHHPIWADEVAQGKAQGSGSARPRPAPAE